MTIDSQREVEAFLKYATPRLNYIFDDDFDGMTKEAVGIGAVPRLLHIFARYGTKGLSRAWGHIGRGIAANGGNIVRTVSQAADGAKMLQAAKGMEQATKGLARPGLMDTLKLGGSSLLKELYGWTLGIPAKTMQSVGRWMGAEGTMSGGRFLPKLNSSKWANKLIRGGRWLDSKLGGGISRLQARQVHDMIRRGISPTQAHKLRRLLGHGASLGLMGTWMAADEDSVLGKALKPLGKFWEYGSPLGLAMTGGQKLYNMAQQKGFDAAGQAALQTYSQMAQGINDAGRKGHLLGLLSPDKYNQQLQAMALPALREAFAREAQSRGVNNTFDRLLSIYEGNNKTYDV